jgi:hypothetical protein
VHNVRQPSIGVFLVKFLEDTSVVIRESVSVLVSATKYLKGWPVQSFVNMPGFGDKAA